ncbi:POK9 protein, partial [Sagittarius serpentarius]|nr:POK9 protein [Sagittarius serpentarius]
GSLGLDVETTVDVTLGDTTVQKIPSNAFGPLYHCNSQIGGLLLGRPSAGVKGLIILPGVIDADYTGQFYIMAYTICPPLFIPQGSRIAQILAFASPMMVTSHSQTPRGNQGFGSTGAAVCFTTKMENRPMITVKISQGGVFLTLSAMLDAGVDITIIN